MTCFSKKKKKFTKYIHLQNAAKLVNDVFQIKVNKGKILQGRRETGKKNVQEKK